MTSDRDELRSDSPLPLARDGFELQRALLTTFEPADDQLLLNHFLPALFGIDDGPKRTVEVLRQVARLRGKFTVISSPGQPRNGGAAWLWRFIAMRTTHSVQHSKLWLFHWKHPGTGEEWLDVSISSCNLTASAFDNQIQAMWRTSVQLNSQGPKSGTGWGQLDTFLETLGKSAHAELDASYFQKQLARFRPPPDVTFIASGPELDGLEALGSEFAGGGEVEIQVIAPTVGSWNPKSLKEWCGRLHGNPEGLRLAWIDEKHPWSQHWAAMPRASADCLKASLREVPTRLNPDGESRWSHAKLYGLKKGKMQRFLLTSANFSPSAWFGKAEQPANFELGVLLKDTFPTDLELKLPQSAPHVSDTAVEVDEGRPWLSAEWDGVHVTVNASATGSLNIDGGSGIELPTTRHHVPWTAPAPAPCFATLTVGGKQSTVSVIDVRENLEHVLATVLAELPKDTAKLMDQVVFEDWGGAVTDAGEPSEPNANGDSKYSPGVEPTANYEVPELVKARELFLVVDAWADCPEPRPATWARDGVALSRHIAGMGGVAAKVVLDEINVRTSAKGTR